MLRKAPSAGARQPPSLRFRRVSARSGEGRRAGGLVRAADLLQGKPLLGRGAGRGRDRARGETRFDYELELGVFLSRKGKDIRPEDAYDHIFGYCIFNDFTARTAQLREMTGQLGPAKGKDFDTGNAMGPWLVTADEVSDPHNLTMTARINGEEWSRGNSGEMHHKFPAVLAHISSDETLYAGEFIGSGTVGSGCGLELGRFLKHGDVVELEIEGLGILRNRVVDRSAGV
ncbi:fumarylacetoacetate hydrolase family protein [Neoaquamicrobium sediminum]|uniref:fumarylacetoacetate hydrolase family protein n=1 Tax=Neoaquamicrobium sediminum TaxID=1849104 RepID=UPI0028A5A38D|nr:fumarylacetoacetate hydrolase family protein [Mesorhizobium sediminum]